MSDGDGTEEIRKKISLTEIDEKTISHDPYEQFGLWLKDASESGLIEHNAMIIATSDRAGIPSVRTVLLKSFDKQGFVFFTNYTSKKANDLLENHYISALFLWKEISRQIRITGTVQKVSQEESEAYFRSRPVESQLGAWASKQSDVIPNREHLIQSLEKYRERFVGKEIPLPPFWGGYRLNPTEFEFWQGRDNRLHDRICYTQKVWGWHTFRLSP
jgi:pyridoxamine 5'-phosphate oxidase